MNIPDQYKLLTEEEAAEYLGLKKHTLAAERANGRIKPLRIVCNRIRYTYQMLFDYAQNHPLNKNSEKQDSESEHKEAATALQTDA